MMKSGFVLIIAVLASQVISEPAKNPRDLVAEVREQLDQLRAIVQGEILQAHGQLDDLEQNYFSHGYLQESEAIVAIEQEQEQIQQQLNAIKELAQSAQKDISACTDIREELLGRLPAEYYLQMRRCISDKNGEETIVIVDATYIIDVFMNEVHRFDFQIDRCNGDFLCLSPLISEIERDRVRIPLNIRSEINSVATLLDRLSLSVDQCANTAVTQYVGDASALLHDIAQCVDNILGKQ